MPTASTVNACGLSLPLARLRHQAATAKQSSLDERCRCQHHCGSRHSM